ncbi:MAG: glycosyltransferase family 39 protein, partial [Candidatus Marithrix sp.]|nr:glycosyltransferase family 39 protein [Candidatus Marithrix sp.]
MKKSFIVLIIIFIGIGLLSRLEPLLDEQRMLNTVSEDGYLMMTIARNMALGSNMSTAEGTIPTNGTQPLTTFLWAGVYWLEAGDKIDSIFWITILECLIATLAAFLLWRFGLYLLRERPNHNYIASLAAATWYVSPFISNHTMNGLETGFYGLLVILTMMFVVGRTKPWDLKYAYFLGIFLGLVFWTRNDASWLILAICLVHLFTGENKFWQRFWQVNVMGITSVLVAIPWLIYNKINFGSIMPISGQAQALTAELGQNLSALPPVLVEYFFVFLPIPNSLQKLFPVILFCIGLLVVISLVLVKLWAYLR